MRAVWVDDGQTPDYAKLARYGIGGVYFAGNDARLTPAYLQSVKDHAGVAEVGLYYAWNWYPVQAAKALARTISEAVKAVGWLGNPPVCIDIEKGHGLTDANYTAYAVAFFQEWRRLRPSRKTAYTLEGFQGGLFGPADVLHIAAANLEICPQMYAGNMAPLAHDVTIDLLIQGFPAAQLSGMYDAAALPYNWRGFAFTQGRLP